MLFPCRYPTNNTMYSNELLSWLSGWSPVTQQQQRLSGNLLQIGAVLPYQSFRLVFIFNRMSSALRVRGLNYDSLNRKLKNRSGASQIPWLWYDADINMLHEHASLLKICEFFRRGCRQYILHSERLRHPQGTMYICRQILTCAPSAWAGKRLVFMFTSATLIKYVKRVV